MALKKKNILASLVLCTLGVVSIGLTGCGSAKEKEVEPAVINKEQAVDLGEFKGDVEAVQGLLDNMYKDGAYFQLRVSENAADNLIFIYNSNKECYADTPEGRAMYYDNKGHRRVFDSPYWDSVDLSPLQMTESALDMVRYGEAEISARDMNLEDSWNSTVEAIKKSREENEASGEENTAVESEEGQSGEEDTSVDSEGGYVGQGGTVNIESNLDGNEIASVEVKEENLTVEEEAERYLGFTLEDVKGQSIREIVISINGRDNIYKLYNNVAGSGGEEAVDKLFEGDDNKEDDAYELVVNLPNKENELDRSGVLLKVKSEEAVEGIGWFFEGYLSLGDWEGLPDGWLNKDLKVEEVTSDFEGVIDRISKQLQKFQEENLTEEQINKMKEGASEEEVENASSESGETVEGVEGVEVSSEEKVISEPVAILDSVERNGSFNDIMNGLLEKDGLLEVDVNTFEIPEGYNESDKARMIDLYNKIVEWDNIQSDGVLVSPLSPDDVEFINSYIEKCTSEYNKIASNNGEAVDKYGTVYWKDTLGLFVSAIK